MEELKKVVADAIRRSGASTVVANKVYTAEELAREVEAETEVGKKMVEMVVRGTVERLTKSGGR